MFHLDASNCTAGLEPALPVLMGVTTVYHYMQLHLKPRLEDKPNAVLDSNFPIAGTAPA